MTTIKYEIFPEIFHDTGEIHLNSSLAGDKIKTEVMKTKDAATRSALIALGWTPPDQPRSLPDGMGYESLDKDGPVGSALTWLDAALKCESFRWDWDQKEYAEDALSSAREWMEKLGPVPSRTSPPVELRKQANVNPPAQYARPTAPPKPPAKQVKNGVHELPVRSLNLLRLFHTKMTPETERVVCAHDVTVPEVFQDYGDSVHRACWSIASKCKKCGDVFVYDTQFGLFDDLNKEGVCT